MRAHPPSEGLPNQKCLQMLRLWNFLPESHNGGPVPAHLVGTMLQIFPNIDMLACCKALSLLLLNRHAAKLSHHGKRTCSTLLHRTFAQMDERPPPPSRTSKYAPKRCSLEQGVWHMHACPRFDRVYAAASDVRNESLWLHISAL